MAERIDRLDDKLTSLSVNEMQQVHGGDDLAVDPGEGESTTGSNCSGCTSEWKYVSVRRY